jgi:hypothetical protein
LKCSSSKELLDKIQKALHDLNLEADTYQSGRPEKLNEISTTPNECVRDPLNGVISFRIPPIIKGPKMFLRRTHERRGRRLPRRKVVTHEIPFVLV